MTDKSEKLTEIAPKKHRGEHLKPYFWAPGQSGNPKGRPKGLRNKMSEDFIRALAEDFQKHGKETVENVRIEKPDVYLKVLASLVPKEMHLKVDPLEELTDEQLIERARSLANFLRDLGIYPLTGADTEAGEAEPVKSLPPVCEAKGIP